VISGRKVKKFSGSSVNFVLEKTDYFIVDISKFLFFRHILSNEAIGIFIQSSFPGGIRMREKIFCVQPFGDLFVFIKFTAVIGCDGMDTITENLFVFL
jgi:hypothetical protein